MRLRAVAKPRAAALEDRAKNGNAVARDEAANLRGAYAFGFRFVAVR